MMNRTIERVRRTGTWMLHPACLIDIFLDQLEKLSAVVALPTQRAGLLHSEAAIWPPLDEHAGAWRNVNQ